MLDTLKTPKQTSEDPHRPVSNSTPTQAQAPAPPSFYTQHQPPNHSNNLNSPQAQSQIRQIIENIRALPNPAPTTTTNTDPPASKDVNQLEGFSSSTVTPGNHSSSSFNEPVVTNGEHQKSPTRGVKRGLEDAEEEHTNKKVAV